MKRLGYFLASLLSGAPVEEEVSCKPNASDGGGYQSKEKRAGKVLACCDPTDAEFYEEWKPFATTCCYCGEEILPSDPVILHPLSSSEHVGPKLPRERVSVVGGDKVVGCLRAFCSPVYSESGDGYWTKTGYCPHDKFNGI